MPTLFDVVLEIHSPGLDLNHERWNHHVIFMEDVHRHANDLAELAADGFAHHGRGSVWIGQEQWMLIIEGAWEASSTTFPCSYLHGNVRDAPEDLSRLGAGYQQMMAEYDPSLEFVLTVLHHPGELLSAYQIRFAQRIADDAGASQ